MAEGVGFEPTRPYGLPVFKTGALNRYATPPKLCLQNMAEREGFEPSRGLNAPLPV